MGGEGRGCSCSRQHLKDKDFPPLLSCEEKMKFEFMPDVCRDGGSVRCYKYGHSSLCIICGSGTSPFTLCN